MMGFITLNRTQQKVLFLFSLTLIYLLLITYLDFLRGPYVGDEYRFWKSSLTFSDRLIPTLEDLKTYNSLNTPLPFMVFGMLKYLFGGGVFAGRLLNLGLSLCFAVIIGWPTKSRGSRAILCLIGLLMCPYFLWLSGRLYTEMVACIWVLLGMMAYVRDRPVLSGGAFVLAIASRQYMLAFPVAICLYELLRAAQAYWQTRQIDWSRQMRWLAPGIAALSILGWFALFQGLAPATPTANAAPKVQKTLWALELGGAINFLAFVGTYLVIPELILFPPKTPITTVKKVWKRWLLIALLLLAFCLVSPPAIRGYGNLIKLAELLPHYFWQVGLYYGLALIACIRFARPDLVFWLVAVHAAMMTKAWPWDRYVLPLAIVFWYLKSSCPQLEFPCKDKKEEIRDLR